MAEDSEDEQEFEAPDGAAHIIVVRQHPVMLAAQVAKAFHAETREVTQTVRRNPAKFTASHAFELTEEEVADLTSQGVISKPGRGGSRSPHPLWSGEL